MKKIFYRVQSGDTVTSVAKHLNIPVLHLIRQNNLSCEISAGDMLFVEIPNRNTYTVKVGDTLWSIARRFNLSENKILQDNGISYIFYGLSIFV